MLPCAKKPTCNWRVRGLKQFARGESERNGRRPWNGASQA